MRHFIASLLITVLLAPAAFAHGDNSHFPHVQDATVKSTKVAGNIYILQGRGGNVGASVGPEGILIVDDDYEQMSAKLSAALKDLGAAVPRYVLNTHWHGDHTQGNLLFGKDSVIIAHENVRKRVSQDQNSKFFNMLTKAYPQHAWPAITYKSEISIHFNGEEIRAVHYPKGHTDGDSVIFFTRSNVVHLGDDFFVGKFPVVDLESGGSVQGLIDNIASLIKEIPADAKIIPGHGPVATLADLKDYHTMLVETSQIVRDAMKQNKTLEEIKKAGFPEKFKSYGTGFIKQDLWISLVYWSYGGK